MPSWFVHHDCMTSYISILYRCRYSLLLNGDTDWVLVGLLVADGIFECICYLWACCHGNQQWTELWCVCEPDNQTQVPFCHHSVIFLFILTDKTVDVDDLKGRSLAEGNLGTNKAFDIFIFFAFFWQNLLLSYLKGFEIVLCHC